MKHIENVWYVKDREGEKHMKIYLYVDILNDSGIYEVLGKVLDICLILDIEVVYVLTKLPKSRDKIKYQLSLSMYDTKDESTKMCKQIINEITQDIISIVIYLFCVIVTVSLHFYNLVFIDI